MKIVHIGQKGIPAQYGGIERHVDELSSRQARLGHDVVVYVRKWYTPKDMWMHNGVMVQHTPSIPTKHLDAITHTFFSILHAWLVTQPDVVHLHGVGPSLLAWLPRLLMPSATVITTFHSIDRTQEKWKGFARLSLRLGEWACVTFSHETITVSKTLQRYIELSYQRSSTVLPNGVHPWKGAEPKIIKELFGLTRGSYILSVSRLIPCKGVDRLIRAFQSLDMDKRLVIVGDNSNEPAYVEGLKKLAANDPRILFTGMQQGRALQELFSNTALFVQASTTEGMSIALLEALASKVPVLASDIPANREVLYSGTRRSKPLGATFRMNNVSDLAEKMYEALNTDTTEQVQRAHKIVMRQFAWDTVAEKTVQLYQAVQAHRLLRQITLRRA